MPRADNEQSVRTGKASAAVLMGGASLGYRWATPLGNERQLSGKLSVIAVLGQVTTKLVYRIANGIDSATSHGGWWLRAKNTDKEFGPLKSAKS
jgi:hypothetical protein